MYKIQCDEMEEVLGVHIGGINAGLDVDCDWSAEGENMDDLVEAFRQHVENEHPQMWENRVKDLFPDQIKHMLEKHVHQV